MTHKPIHIQPPAHEPPPAASHGLCTDPSCLVCWGWLSTFPDVQDAPGELPPQIVSIKLDDATYAALMAAAGRDAKAEDVARDVLRAWAVSRRPDLPDRMKQDLDGQIGALKRQAANFQKERDAAIGESPAALERHRRGSR